MGVTKEKQQYESRFEPQAREFLCVTDSMGVGAGKAGQNILWTASIGIFAYIDAGVLHQEESRLSWLETEEQRQNAHVYDLKPHTIYRVLAHKGKREFRLLEVLEENCADEKLQEALRAYQTPCILHDDMFGAFTLNRALHFYEGHAKWMGAECDILLNAEEDTSVHVALQTLHQFFAHMEEMDTQMRTYAAEQLTDNANEWAEDADTPALTKEEFAKRMIASELSVDDEGGIEFYFADDDMFYGHVIILSITPEGEMTNAYIAG